MDQLIIPNVMRMEIMKSLHDGVGGGHLGVKKMSLKIRDRFYWAGWQKDVELYCIECLTCASRKDPGRKPRAPLISNKSGGPFEKVALDVLGPLPATKRWNK